MMKQYLLILLGILFSCEEVKNKEGSFNLVLVKPSILTYDSIYNLPIQNHICDSLGSGLCFVKKENYSLTKLKQLKLREKLKTKYSTYSEANKEAFLDSISFVFSNHLLNEIIPYWYGTPWDFEGHTSEPNKGNIACGYFVSTTIRDMGIIINRYQLARQNPENEARTLAIHDSLVISITNDDKEDFQKELLKLGVGLYFVGLDNHVGFFYKTEYCNYFIHSNYIENRVMIENGETSTAFDSYDYYFTKISGNRNLMHSWLSDKRVEVVKKA